MTNDQNPFIEGFLNGDPDIFNDIYTNTFQNVVRFITSRGGSQKEAEDIFQNSLVHLYVKLKEGKLQIESFENYLFIVCRNLWRSESAKKNRVTKLDTVPLVSDEIDKAVFYAEQSQWELYMEKFELLSEQCQQILKMTFNKRPYTEIVKAYKYASQTVARQRVFKCKSRLIKLIKKDKRYILFKK